jgi:ribosome-binding factor A
MSLHTDQVASVIHRAVQAVLTRGLNDPRVRGMISVTRVKVSADLSQARIHVSIIPPENADLAMHGLRNAARHIRHEISSEVRLRRVPQLTFELDQSLKKEAEVLAAISRARKEDDQSRQQRQPRGESEDTCP